MSIKIGEEEYYTREELASILKVHPRTISSWHTKRGMPYSKVVGKSLLINAKDFNKWFKEEK